MFVPCGPAGKRVLTKPPALFDPHHELLTEIFRHRPGDGGGGEGGEGEDDDGSDGSAAFPGGESADHAWLAILTELGLRSKVDKEVFLESHRTRQPGRAAATRQGPVRHRKVQHERKEETGEQVAVTGKSLG